MRSISRVVINREDIVRYDHDVKQKIITIYVGKGSDDGLGNFVQEPSQSSEVFMVTRVDYDLLVGNIVGTNKLINAITPNDLWTAVDAIMARRNPII